MNVTVFGGAGFLGSHVADCLSEQGHNVLIFDRAKSPYLRPDQEMLVGNILDEKNVRKAVEFADVVYNFIALADIEEASQDPIETVKINILGNTIILDAARRANVKRYLFASTIYVYSDSGSFYRSSKQACELLIENYHTLYGLDYTILRYGSLYGPRTDERNFIYSVLKTALLDKVIEREGDGEEIREYIHVYDASKLSVEVLNEEYRNRCIIVTGNEQIKIKDLLTMMKEILKGDVTLKFLPAKSHEHYEITPYVFKPQMATKIRGKEHLDMGQGVLDILDEIHQKYIREPQQEVLPTVID